jgi:hypothetical protein
LALVEFVLCGLANQIGYALFFYDFFCLTNKYMENSFKTQELKQLLYKDLKIDMAFPFFPLGAKAGSAACCVVMTI